MIEHLHCPGCGLVLEEIEETIALLERDIRIKRSQISRLQGERASAPSNDPHWSAAKAVFNYWRQQLHPQAREFNDARRDKVLARLRAGHSVDQIKLAIDGCKRSHFHTSKGHTDLELICRDEQHLDRFIALARKPEPAPANGNGQLAIGDDLLGRKDSVIDAVRRALRT